jgi:hypothetical protein
MAKMDISPVAFNERIEVLYMAITGKKNPRGAFTWLGEELGIPPRTLGRWSAGDTRPPKMLGLLLGYIEQYDVGDRVMAIAVLRHDAYEAKRKERAR